MYYNPEAAADKHEALELGRADPDAPWVLTNRDVWHRNPFYSGPPARHPEDDYDDEEEAERLLDEMED